MTINTVERAHGVDRERLHWSFEIDGDPHTLELLPAAVGGSVALELDGRRVGRMPKPKSQRPWRETALEIDGRSLVVALAWHQPVMHTDVFLEARSLRDGRSIEEVQLDAPPQLSTYETWIGGWFESTDAPSKPLLPRRLGLLALGAIVVPVVSFLVLPHPMPPAMELTWATIALIAYGILMLIWLRSWVVVARRVHARLLTRPELGDAGRALRFFGAFVGYGLASLVALWALAVILAVASG